MMLTERIKIGSGSHRNMAIFEFSSTRTTTLGISESYVARSHHMLSLTCFHNQAKRLVHTASAATHSGDQEKPLFVIGLTESSQ